MAGYSGTPLAKKLGLNEDGTTVALGPMPESLDLGGVPLKKRLGPSADVVLFFTVERAKLEHHIDRLGAAIHPAGAIWVCWPKRASKVPTDMTEDVVRDVVLPLGLVDVKVCAVDEVWSGLKVVWRKERR
jgi:hypothetical protein